MRTSILLATVGLWAACGAPAPERPIAHGPAPGDDDAAGFMAAIDAVTGVLQTEREDLPTPEIRVDPRPIPRDVGRELTAEDLPSDTLPLVTRRSRLLEAAGIPAGDILAAQECNHVFGMGGLLIAPLSEQQEELAETCSRAFDGLTLAVSRSVPGRRNDDAVALYTVLVLGSDAERGWTVAVDRNGEVISVDRFMNRVS